jgi:signal transduction histidine kinase
MSHFTISVISCKINNIRCERFKPHSPLNIIMEDKHKTKDQLIAELAEMRQRTAEMEKLRTKFSRVQKMMREAVVRANDEKAKTEAIIATLGDGISIQDIHYKVLFQNERHKQLVGDHAGEYCYKAYQKKNQVCEGCHLSLSYKDGGIHKKEQFRITDKGTIYYEIISSSLRNARGEIVAGIEAVRDITERKNAEIEKENLIAQLKEALERINTLKGMIPMCAWCKKIRDDRGYWSHVEQYVEEHTEALFTHGICPDCIDKVKEEEENEQ